MTLSVWTEKSNYSLGTVSERISATIPLPTINDTGVSYSIISGALPGGLRLLGNQIVGTPYEVSRLSEFTFCVRASKDSKISDRTLKISIEGADEPVFTTDAGELPVGPNNQLFALDSTYVDFQIDSYDFDTAAGQKLSFFIADNDGELPPGLILTDDGRIVGFVKPVLSIKPEDGNGFYDTGPFDAVAYDFGLRPTNGYDTYIYDEVFYDFSIVSQGPKKLNRNYEFIVSLTDGDTVAKRKFKIFVVGTDYFKADNNTLTDGTGLFTADSTYLRSPIWLTPPNLGLFRANNYVTILLDTYDTENVIYVLELVNADVYTTSKQILVNDNIIGSSSLTIYNSTTIPVIGQYVTFTGYVIGATSALHQINAVADLGNGEYRLSLTTPLEVTIPDNVQFLIGSKSVLPPGMDFDPNNAEIFGRVPYQPAITNTYNFTVTAKRYSDPSINANIDPENYVPDSGVNAEIAKSFRKFTVKIIGEIDSVITWNTDSNLGTINANFISTLTVHATSTVPDAVVTYRLISGRLPPGLYLDLDGEIIGKVNQFGDNIVYRSFWKADTSYPLHSVVKYQSKYYRRTSAYTTSELSFDSSKWIEHIFTQEGMTTFSDNGYVDQSFDNGTTTIDRIFAFTVEARDQFNYSATQKTFKIAIDTPNQITFSNIRVMPFLKMSQRSSWKEFINNTSIFTPDYIYRPNDPNFGIQTTLSMLVYAGIETSEAAAYVSAMGLNHKKKRFHFGDVKKAVAKIPGTNTQVYEIIYIEMVDPLEINGRSLSGKLKSLVLQNPTITADTSNEIWQSGFEHGFDENGNMVPGHNDIRTILGEPYPYSTRPERVITADGTGYYPSSPNPVHYYPNSITNWRNRIKAVGSKERNYLPLWMRTIQPGTMQELDFVLCVPLCFCKVGVADNILLNIKYSDFDFKLLDYTIDRYIIDAVEGSTEDKYLIFRNDRITV